MRLRIRKKGGDMKKFLVVLAVSALFLVSATSFAWGPDFSQPGWHKGPYLAANVGMMQVTNDKHIITNKTFDGPIDPAFGLTFGWDIADWIGPILQINYATATSGVGVAGAVTHDGVTYDAGTFPVQSGVREHALDFTLAARATLPYFINANWQPESVKIIPYAKLGGTGHALFVNASVDANKAGAVGGGPAIGLGCEFFIWKGLFIALDATENLIIQQSFTATLTDSSGTPRKTKITEGGFRPQFELVGMFGWHF